MRDLLQLSDNKILLLLFITAMFICVCSNILLVYSILEGEKKMKKICSIFGSFLLLLVFGFIICMTKYLFGRYFWFGLSFLIFYIPFWYGKIRLCTDKGKHTLFECAKNWALPKPHNILIRRIAMKNRRLEIRLTEDELYEIDNRSKKLRMSRSKFFITSSTSSEDNSIGQYVNKTTYFRTSQNRYQYKSDCDIVQYGQIRMCPYWRYKIWNYKGLGRIE